MVSKELIERLLDLSRRIRAVRESGADWRHFSGQDALDVAHAAAAVERQQWTPVSEGLPEDMGSYLCLRQSRFRVIEMAFFNSQQDWCAENDFIYDVTHWMSLPPLPRIDK